MITKMYLLSRFVLSGLLTIFLGVVFSLIFSEFSVNNLKFFAAMLLYMAELLVTHAILWVLFKVLRKKSEKFWCKNIIIAEGVGSVTFVFVVGIIVNNDFDLLFLTVTGLFWMVLKNLWDLFDDQEKCNKQVKTDKKKPHPKKRNNSKKK